MSNVNQVTLAGILGVSRRTLTTYMKQGMPIYKRNAEGGRQHLFETADIISWWVEKQIENRFGDLDNAEESLNREHEQARLAKANADGRELDNAVKRGELAPVEIISKVLSQTTSQIAAILDSIPQQVKRRVPSLSATDMEVIKKEIIKIQNSASEIEVEKKIAELIRDYQGR